ncbi:MAG: hypothetical protein N3F66_00900 [Spirochaetes bacterium]|nr:hypothetical protein [Spirochaetota bacterium]
MFIPLSIGAYFLTPGYAVLAGAIAPITSTIVTGMPPLYPPITFIMVVELSIFCCVISALKHKFNLNNYLVIITAIIIDRIVLYILYAFLLPYFKISVAVFSIYDLFKSFPGIILLIIITPPAVISITSLLQKIGDSYGK